MNKNNWESKKKIRQKDLTNCKKMWKWFHVQQILQFFKKVIFFIFVLFYY